ncbi:cytochrome P450 302a1, mitochondrial-like isoform X2 [Lycorma delicatula]|uniref:cytochrome P450 302a1, mitochondrial-like isoform X2 n=1 Tax=Lycorma delicatula TaxID=130591 RepID=UPI003F50DDB1
MKVIKDILNVYQKHCMNIRRASLKRLTTKPDDKDTSQSYVKPFNEIPGPKSLPVVGTLWQYLPYIGEYQLDNLAKNGLLKLREYGPVVREDILPGVSIIWVYTPEDIETVYRCEGRYPERRSHLALKKYRLDRPHIYNTGGLLPTNGPEWWHLRSCFQRNLSRIQDVRSFLKSSDLVIREFISMRVKEGCVQDFLPELSRLYLELTCLAAFNERFNSFEKVEMNSNFSRTSKLIEATWTINSCILGTDNGLQLWKVFPKLSPLYRKLEKAHQYLEKVAIEQVSLKCEQIKNDENHIPYSLIEFYLASTEVDKKDVIGMAVDLLLAGIDTMTYTSCFALYHIARNSEVQELLFKEACSLLPTSDTPVTSKILSQASYTKAVIKETFRLNPIAVGVGRILHKDAVLSGYHVPSGTVVVTQNQVTCRLPEYFPKPDTFLPERWLKSLNHVICSPFLLLPFSHGPRTCIARRLAEQNLQAFLLQVVRNFKISWLGDELNVKSLLINKPDKPISLKFNLR